MSISDDKNVKSILLILWCIVQEYHFLLENYFSKDFKAPWLTLSNPLPKPYADFTALTSPVQVMPFIWGKYYHNIICLICNACVKTVKYQITNIIWKILFVSSSLSPFLKLVLSMKLMLLNLSCALLHGVKKNANFL